MRGSRRLFGKREIKFQVPEWAHSFMRKVEPRWKSLKKAYQREHLAMEKSGAFSTPLQRKITVLTTCSGSLLLGYAAGCDRANKVDIVIGMVVGGCGGAFLGGILWPALPYMPVAYAGFKAIEIATRHD
uniref:Uncharacterized protein n=1 Tax=viral metagenome TaxID=1070528 RepID=A0A6C0BLZ1_9ZZZZ